MTINFVVPYRDRVVNRIFFITEFQSFRHLLRFESSLIFVEQLGGAPFNRGKLLNAAFLYLRSQGAENFCFHDVDFMPGYPSSIYAPAEEGPVHPIGKVRMIDGVIPPPNNDPVFEPFGGVNIFSASQFEAINGFPNNFWGWGYEDTCLLNRVKRAGMNVVRRRGEFIALSHEKQPHQDQTSKQNWMLCEADDGTSGLTDIGFDVVENIDQGDSRLLAVDIGAP